MFVFLGLKRVVKITIGYFIQKDGIYMFSTTASVFKSYEIQKLPNG
jgi:hypothetical protein